MGELKDLTGQRFGKLVVLSRAGSYKNGRTYRTLWRVRCDCGREKVVIANNLKRGLTTSCGHCYKETTEWSKERIKSLVGKRFGRIVVTEELGKRKVRVQCDCGNEKTVSKSALTAGEIRSCGCLLAETPRKNIEPYMFDGTDIARIRSDKPTSRSKSGIKGVCWHKSKKKWRANIGIKGQKIDLGYFDDIEDAIKARKAAEEKYFAPVLEAWEKEHNDGN